LAFKECTTCGTVWSEREEALSDPSFQFVGYDPDYREMQEGLFLFNHLRPDCNTTLAVKADEFADLYTDPVFATCDHETDDCEAFCLRGGEPETCHLECDCAFVEAISKMVREWPKVSN
jgi:hypothetical protein